MKKELVNIDRLQELKEKVIELFNSENITIFESQIVMKEILKDHDDEYLEDRLENVLKKIIESRYKEK